MSSQNVCGVLLKAPQPACHAQAYVRVTEVVIMARTCGLNPVALGQCNACCKTVCVVLIEWFLHVQLNLASTSGVPIEQRRRNVQRDVEENVEMVLASVTGQIRTSPDLCEADIEGVVIVRNT